MSTTPLFTRGGREQVANAVYGRDKPGYGHTKVCHRCGGVGRSEAWAMTGYTCYECNGSGKGVYIVEALYTAEKLAKLVAAAQKRADVAAAKSDAKRAKHLADMAADRDGWLKRNQDFLESLESLRDVPFWDGFRSSFIERQADPTARQLELMTNEIAKRAAQAASQYIGQVGDKVELELTVERVINCSYGEFPRILSFLHLCRDTAGNIVIYKGAGNFMHEGKSGKVKATVKTHETFRGAKQTYIQRPKMLHV